MTIEQRKQEWWINLFKHGLMDLPANYKDTLHQLLMALGPYPVILRRNGLLAVLYRSSYTPRAAMEIGHFGGPRFSSAMTGFHEAVRSAQLRLGPHPTDWTLATMYKLAVGHGSRPALTTELSFDRENLDSTYNRMRRLEKAGMVGRAKLGAGSTQEWVLTEDGFQKAAVVALAWRWRS